MPITTLDPTTALIVIDLQKGVIALPTLTGADAVISRSARLITAFRARALPVVLVNVAGSAPGRTDQAPRRDAPPADWAELVPELAQTDSDILITKRTWGTFSGTKLHDRLQALGVTQVVLCGIATSIGVESTARQAHELGYHVSLATDAMADLNPDAHQNSLQRIFPRLGESGTVDEIIAKLT